MTRSGRSATEALLGLLADLLPGVLAGLALFGPQLGLGGPLFGLVGEETKTAGMSLALSLSGLAFGLDRARRHGSLRLGLGVACCAFVSVYAFLQLF